MISLNEKLSIIKKNLETDKIHIMIIGLGSVGNYLLDYLMSLGDEKIEICVVGRNDAKIMSDVNVIKIASSIRQQNRSNILIEPTVNLENVSSIVKCLRKYNPDIIVNTSRAYPRLKYGSISWKSIRAYGIWAPLAVKYIKNIMQAYENVDSDAIVINTSYSDAVIPWLKSAGMAYPDLGSGNINHLIPRIKFAIADEIGIDDYWNIDVTYATAHFHDVVISKEGHSENVNQLIYIEYNGSEISIDINKILSKCCIPMPTDAKRNMMNASSNFEIIQAILKIVRGNTKFKLHCPGAFGEIGGYPVIFDSTNEDISIYIDETHFSLDEMRKKNIESIYLDGIKDVKDGVLFYTPELVTKVKNSFGVDIIPEIRLDESDITAEYLINNIIIPTIAHRGGYNKIKYFAFFGKEAA